MLFCWHIVSHNNASSALVSVGCRGVARPSEESRGAFATHNAGKSIQARNVVHGHELQQRSLRRSRPVSATHGTVVRWTSTIVKSHARSVTVDYPRLFSKTGEQYHMHVFLPVIAEFGLNEPRGFGMGRAADGSDVFVVGHADGSVYVCERGKEPCLDPQFAAVKDVAFMQLTMAPKAAKHSPTARCDPSTISTRCLRRCLVRHGSHVHCFQTARHLGKSIPTQAKASAV
jgi:hypothetical protein